MVGPRGGCTLLLAVSRDGGLNGCVASPRDVRASDDERTLVVERLDRALATGRLGPDEYSERVGAAYRARTRGELTDLTADLPGNLW